LYCSGAILLTGHWQTCLANLQHDEYTNVNIFRRTTSL